MQKIYLARDFIEAERIREYLTARGVAVHLSDVFTHSLQAVNPMAFPSVWIGDDEHPGHVRVLIEDFLRQEYGQSALRMQWSCAVCGEINPAGFELCWHCGTAPAQE